MPTFFKSAVTFLTLFISTTLYAETQYPLTIEDGMGNTLTFDEAPELISSKTLFTDEILLSILSADRLSSLTNIASDANFSNIADQLPEGVPLLSLNVEAVLGNMPDLVFAANWSDAGIVEQLKQTGIQVYLVNTPFTFEGIEAEILKLGRIVNASDNAQELVDQMKSELLALSEKRAAIAAQQLVALDYNSWGSSSGVDTTWQAVMNAAGLINGAQPFEQGGFGQVVMSKELIVEINPDILFLPGWIYGESDAADNFYEQVINDPALADVKAVQSGRVYRIPEHLRGTYSQYIVDTVEYVIDQVSQDL